MRETMKSKNIKNVVVERKFKDSLDINEYAIDADIFDDIYMEAATRYVESIVKKPGCKISPILFVYEKRDKDNVDKHFVYNSYYVMINAGSHKKAEIVRYNYKKSTNIDLKNESIKSIGN